MKAVLSITIFAATALGLVVGGSSDRKAAKGEIDQVLAVIGLGGGARSLDRQADVCTDAADAENAMNNAFQSCAAPSPVQVRLPSKDAVQIQM